MNRTEPILGKNVSLKLSTIETIIGYQNRTKKNFSQTLNIMVEEWDKFSIAIQKLKDEQYLKELNEAKVIKQ